MEPKTIYAIILACISFVALQIFIKKSKKNKESISEYVKANYSDVALNSGYFSQKKDSFLFVNHLNSTITIISIEEEGIIQFRYPTKSIKKIELYINEYLVGSEQSEFDFNSMLEVFEQVRGDHEPSVFVKLYFEEGPIRGHSLYLMENMKAANIDGGARTIISKAISLVLELAKEKNPI